MRPRSVDFIINIEKYEIIKFKSSLRVICISHHKNVMRRTKRDVFKIPYSNEIRPSSYFMCGIQFVLVILKIISPKPDLKITFKHKISALHHPKFRLRLNYTTEKHYRTGGRRWTMMWAREEEENQNHYSIVYHHDLIWLNNKINKPNLYIFVWNILFHNEINIHSHIQSCITSHRSQKQWSFGKTKKPFTFNFESAKNSPNFDAIIKTDDWDWGTT